MKKFNKNILLFVFFAVFVVVGLWGSCFGELKTEVASLFSKIGQGNIGALLSFNKQIDEVSSKKLSYHGTLMDINSMKDNLLGTKVSIEKDVVKSESGSLIKVSDEMTPEQINKTVKRLAELQNVAEGSGARFLYCAVPDKSYYEQAPANTPDFNRQNYAEFIRQLGKENIPHINFVDYFAQKGVNTQGLYYRTDHHWTTRTGFLASGAICQELNERYGYPIQNEFTDINNYNVETYNDLFLGSYGKKVGTYFNWSGADDFDLITPKFETDFYEENTVTNEIKQGSFDDVMLNKERLKKDYYNFSTYNTYKATDKQHIRVIKNNLKENDGTKILIVQTSFSQVVSPFLALNCSEIHICDMRVDQGIEDEKPNLKEYINEIKPDVVLVLYNGVTDVEIIDGRYNFF